MKHKIDELEAKLSQLEGVIEKITRSGNALKPSTEGADECVDLDALVARRCRETGLRPVLSVDEAQFVLADVLHFAHQLRDKFFESDLFSDPVWSMMLELNAAQKRNRALSVTSLCFSSGVPGTTALRYLAVMEERGLIRKEADPRDKRRVFVFLSDKGKRQLASYFNRLSSAIKLAA